MLEQVEVTSWSKLEQVEASWGKLEQVEVSWSKLEQVRSRLEGFGVFL